jgi:hypothetical protein
MLASGHGRTIGRRIKMYCIFSFTYDGSDYILTVSRESLWLESVDSAEAHGPFADLGEIELLLGITIDLEKLSLIDMG